MKLIVFSLLTLLGATSLALLIKQDPGYILIDYAGWTFETSLALFLFLLLVTFAALYVTLRTVIRLWQVPAKARDWHVRSQQRAARRALTQGLLELTQGQWKSAEKHLLQHIKHSDMPLIHYLSAARACQQMGEIEKRDQYLQLASQNLGKTRAKGQLAVGVTQAELQYQDGQLEQSLATLQQLHAQDGKNPRILGMMAELYQRLEDWAALAALLPSLKKRKALDEDTLINMSRRTHQALMRDAAQQSAEQLDVLWNQLSRAEKQDPVLLREYLNCALPLEDADTDKLGAKLRDALRLNWDPALLRAYGQLRQSNPSAQYHSAEAWLKEHEQEPVLLEVLGELALRAKLWGKARSFLESSLALEADSHRYRLLGEVLLEMDEPEAAAKAYRSGLECTETHTLDRSDKPFLLHHDPKAPRQHRDSDTDAMSMLGIEGLARVDRKVDQDPPAPPGTSNKEEQSEKPETQSSLSRVNAA